jgi:hypothetical protein
MLRTTELDEDFNEEAWLQAISSNPAFDFLYDSTENIYTSADGNPLQHQLEL